MKAHSVQRVSVFSLIILGVSSTLCIALEEGKDASVWLSESIPRVGRIARREVFPVEIPLPEENSISVELIDDGHKVNKRDVLQPRQDEKSSKKLNSADSVKESGKDLNVGDVVANLTRNATDSPSNVSVPVPALPNSTVSSTVPADEAVLPEKGAAEEEHDSSMSIFFVLCVLALCILLVHLMLQANFHYLPENVVNVFLGALIGIIINLMSDRNIANWKREEAFSPTAFFLVLLPPIIFESGYNLHKGNIFQNIGSILVFAVFGTVISALVIGGGVYLLGVAEVAYRLSFLESFAFGSLVSAVDPVATELYSKPLMLTRYLICSSLVKVS